MARIFQRVLLGFMILSKSISNFYSLINYTHMEYLFSGGFKTKIKYLAAPDQR